jgi:hypothetical protein
MSGRFIDATPRSADQIAGAMNAAPSGADRSAQSGLPQILRAGQTSVFRRSERPRWKNRHPPHSRSASAPARPVLRGNRSRKRYLERRNRAIPIGGTGRSRRRGPVIGAKPVDVCTAVPVIYSQDLEIPIPGVFLSRRWAFHRMMRA